MSFENYSIENSFKMNFILPHKKSCITAAFYFQPGKIIFLVCFHWW